MRITWPWAASEIRLKLSGLLSTSDACAEPVITASSAPDADPSLATGAWLAEVMAMVEVATADWSGPPELPLSWTVRVRATLALGLTAESMKVTTLAPSVLSSESIWATVPLIVTEDEPDPETRAPLEPACTVRAPSATASVTVMFPEPASASAMAIPLFFRSRAVWPATA